MKTPTDLRSSEWIASMATTSSAPKVRATHRQAAQAFLNEQGSPFRRQQLADTLYPRTSPRSRPVADKLAQTIMVAWAKAGDIERHGHLHWVRVSKKRNLRSGRAVPELSELSQLNVDTWCPEKWAAVDMETGQVWIGSRDGWRQSTKAQATEVIMCMDPPGPVTGY